MHRHLFGLSYEEEKQDDLNHLFADAAKWQGEVYSMTRLTFEQLSRDQIPSAVLKEQIKEEVAPLEWPASYR